MAAFVSQPAPDFSADAYFNGGFEKVSLSKYKGKKLVLFFYPLDFTFACPTEITAFTDSLAEFKKRNTEVVGVSVVANFMKQKWANTPREKGGIKWINYPLIGDVNKEIARSFGVLMEGGIALRGLFIIDKNGVLKHSTINDLNLGRNVDEVLRLLDAIDFSEEHGEVCPANWKKGDKAMKPTTAGLKEFVKAK